MEKLVFECETITPMFLGGADGSAELRPPSIKAALRFWWRALNGGLPLDELRKKEAEIFGGSGENEGKSKFSIRVEKRNIRITNDSKLFPQRIGRRPARYRQDRKSDILKYLAFGVFDPQSKSFKKYIAPNNTFTVIITLYDSQYKDIIVKTFRVFATFGGLGAKSRNGYGHFTLKNYPKIEIDELKSLINKSVDPEYSNFSDKCRLYTSDKTFSNWVDALVFIGDIYRIAKIEIDDANHIYTNRVFISGPIVQAKNFNIFKRKAKSHFIYLIKQNDVISTGILYLPYSNLITDKSIYTNEYENSYPASVLNSESLINKRLTTENLTEKTL